MIGDLVMFPSSIEKVQEISYVCGKGYCASFAASATLFPISIDKIKPIHLTPEILEKNGFTYNPFGTGFYECKTEDGNITCTKILDCWLFYINDNMIPNHFHYLHELQHALRLCGIDKEIVL
jgi:hypothetical protein